MHSLIISHFFLSFPFSFHSLFAVANNVHRRHSPSDGRTPRCDSQIHIHTCVCLQFWRFTQIPDDACRSTKPASMEACNAQDCPKWIAREWSGVSEDALFFCIHSSFFFVVVVVAVVALGCFSFCQPPIARKKCIAIVRFNVNSWPGYSDSFFLFEISIPFFLLSETCE